MKIEDERNLVNVTREKESKIERRKNRDWEGDLNC